MYDFVFKGGVRSDSPHHTEKFLVFCVSQGLEISFYEALRLGLLQQDRSTGLNHYKAVPNHLKIFAFQSRFTQTRQSYSFFVRLDPSGADITLKGFGLGAGGFIFSTRGEVLKKSAALGLLDANGISYKLLQHQSPLPKILRRQMREIKYREERPDIIRKIRVGGLS